MEQSGRTARPRGAGLIVAGFGVWAAVATSMIAGAEAAKASGLEPASWGWTLVAPSGGQGLTSLWSILLPASALLVIGCIGLGVHRLLWGGSARSGRPAALRAAVSVALASSLLVSGKLGAGVLARLLMHPHL